MAFSLSSPFRIASSLSNSVMPSPLPVSRLTSIIIFAFSSPGGASPDSTCPRTIAMSSSMSAGSLSNDAMRAYIVSSFRRPRSAAARDVVGQVLDLEALLLRLVLDEVADRHEPDDVVVVDHGQVSDAAVGHDRHRLFDRRLGRDVDERRRHDLADFRVAARAALHGDLPQVVALGHDPDDLVAVGDEDRADVALDDLHERVVDRRAGLDLQDVAALAPEDVGHACHDTTLPAGGRDFTDC